MRRLIILGAVLALTGTACGDDARDSILTASTAAATTEAPAATATTETPATTVAPATTTTMGTTTIATTTLPPTTTTAAPTTTTTTAVTTTTTTLPPPLDPSTWIGVIYSGYAPPGLEFYGGECVPFVDVCDWQLRSFVVPGSLPPLPPYGGPIDFIATLEIQLANGDHQIVDAAVIRGIGTDLVYSECWTTVGDGYVRGVWDRVEGIIGAFRWDAATEDVWVIPGSEVAVCWDPNDTE